MMATCTECQEKSCVTMEDAVAVGKYNYGIQLYQNHFFTKYTMEACL